MRHSVTFYCRVLPHETLPSWLKHLLVMLKHLLLTLGHTVVWSPHLEGDIHTIENVQRRVAKRLPGCSNLTYAEHIELSYAYPSWSFIESIMI